jgi:5,10-methenyltetrahydrofolate synthetase
MGDLPLDSAAFRAALRREKIAARQAQPEALRLRADALIRRRLAELLLPRPPGVLAFCWPIRAEVDCRPLAEELLAAGWRAAMPTVVEPAAPMRFRAWAPGCAMGVDPFGIPVPADDAPLAPDVLLLPLVAFDSAGYRLGYGGGYFDRTLAACAPRPLTVGVGYALAGVASIRPEGHDIPLDMIVTEAMTHRVAPP